MKKILWLCALPALLLTACTKHIDKYNDETKNPAVVPAGTLLANSTVNLVDGLASASVNTNVFRFTTKQWAMTTYQDEAQYDFFIRRINDAWWTRMYRDVLADLNNAIGVVNALPEVEIDAATRANQLAVIDITEVLTYSILTTTFGDVPYTQALAVDSIVFPAYDDAAAITTDLINRLTNDIAAITPGSDGFSEDQDLLGGGDMAKWVKFANSLKMRIGMTLADLDPAAAQAAIESAEAGALTSSDDDIILTYLDAPPNSNPLYDDIVLGQRGDYIASEELMNNLIANNDPRKTQFFTTNNAGEYVGGVVGRVNPLSDYSPPSEKVSVANAPYAVLDYSEVEFLRAEAIERGFSVTGTAAEHYENAIRASIVYWGGTDAEADTYLGQPTVAYATATGEWKEKIGTQKWLAFYNRAYESWLEFRRLDFPAFSLALNAISGYPNRLTYPANEQQVNGGSYTSAAAKIGGDEVETKLFWDIN